MINRKDINDTVKGILDSMPDGVKNLGKDVEENVKSAVTAGFQKMDLVTRDEFDAQAKVLARTREKLEALMKKVDELEGSKKAKKTTKK
ncbi:MAG: accessory factor UbiK family protein [Coxiellaceae bacterium]|nr:accessory factor UbiK family protein [Coxiellaceae bacterium]